MEGMVTVTPRAAEKVREIQEAEGLIDYGLRVGVRGGGCSGLSYLIEFAEAPDEDDYVWQVADGVRLFVDPKSYLYLVGTELDYVESLMETGFKFRNPNVTKECGCGESFTV
jgi:iron-sulfur cluster assembly protein